LRSGKEVQPAVKAVSYFSAKENESYLPWFKKTRKCTGRKLIIWNKIQHVKC
jgi:hypothetical protein